MVINTRVQLRTGNFFDYLNNYQFLKKNSAPRNQSNIQITKLFLMQSSPSPSMTPTQVQILTPRSPASHCMCGVPAVSTKRKYTHARMRYGCQYTSRTIWDNTKPARRCAALATFRTHNKHNDLHPYISYLADTFKYYYHSCILSSTAYVTDGSNNGLFKALPQHLFIRTEKNYEKRSVMIVSSTYSNMGLS